jgi:2-dehydropantoate 2-reductase
MLARAGVPVTLIGRQPHVDAITRRGLVIDSFRFQETVRVPASTGLSPVRDAQLVLVCVKTPDTERTARELAGSLAPDALLVSLQNGVDNAERIYQATGRAPLSAAVYVAVEMAGPGEIRHTGRGDLLLGDALAEAGMCGRRLQLLASVQDVFARAGVPAEIPASIRVSLWTKLAMNCAFNAISALTGVRYGPIVADTGTRAVLSNAVEEVVAVARAAGVSLPLADIVSAAMTLGGESMPNALSSTAQDLQRGKPTEIDALNGYVARLGAQLGVATPVNQALHALVRLAEASRSA